MSQSNVSREPTDCATRAIMSQLDVALARGRISTHGLEYRREPQNPEAGLELFRANRTCHGCCPNQIFRISVLRRSCETPSFLGKRTARTSRNAATPAKWHLGSSVFFISTNCTDQFGRVNPCHPCNPWTRCNRQAASGSRAANLFVLVLPAETHVGSCSGPTEPEA